MFRTENFLLEARNMSEYAALVAIDWADQKHAVSLYDQSTGKREQTMVKHTPAALQGVGSRFTSALRRATDRRLSRAVTWTFDLLHVPIRLTALFKGYFPQVLDWFEDIRTLLVCDFLVRWPQLSLLQRARPATINQFLRSHHSTSKATNARRLAEIKSALPLTNDAAVIT